MWAFFSRRLRMWLVLAVVVPLVSWAMGWLGDRIEARNGPGKVSRALRTGRDWLDRRTKRR
jgi:hypothetical protein